MNHVVLQEKGGSAVSEIVIVALSGVSLLTLGAVYEPFAFVSRAFPKVLARVVLAGDGWVAGTRDVGHMTGLPSSLSDLAKGLENGPRPDTVILCGGPPGFGATDIALRRIVRAASRRGIHLICVGGANFIAAQSGLLQGAAAIPWGMAEAFAERHPDVEMSDSLFIRRGRVDSCVGEAAALDMTLAFIAERFSPAIAHAARVHLAASAPRLGSELQPGCPSIVARQLPEPLCTVVEQMRATIEGPLSISDICREAGVSQRHVERMFCRHLGSTPRDYYRELRLDRARQLIEHTDLGLREIAAACGFASMTSIARHYCRRFGQTPAAARQAAARAAILLLRGNPVRPADSKCRLKFG